MSQYDFGTIDPYTDDGVTLADMLNNWRDAIHSWHRGAARPSYAVAGMAWINDNGGPTNWLVNVYLGPTVGDVVLFTYDTTTGVISAGGGTLVAQATTLPSVRWQSTGNGPDLKAWRATENNDGTLRFGAYSDAGAEIAGITFTRDGKIIADLSGSTGIPSPLVVGATPPASPQPNQLWWNSDNSTLGGGRLYLWFVDVDTSQWVPASPPLGITWTVAPSSDASSVGFASGSNFWAGGDTAMQIANGTQIFSRSFTASDASHPIEVDSTVYLQAPNANAAHGIVGLFIDGAAAAVAQGFTTCQPGSANSIRVYWQGALAAGPHTFTLRLGSLNTSGIYTNMSDSGHAGGGAQKNTMVVREIGVGAQGPQGVPGVPGSTNDVLQKQITNLAGGAYTGAYPTSTGAAPTTAGGALLGTINLTPHSAASRIDFDIVVKGVAYSANQIVMLALFDGATLIDCAGFYVINGAGCQDTLPFRTSCPSPGTTARTYTLRIGTNSGQSFGVNQVNNGSTTPPQNGMQSWFNIFERAP
jgi:hypothetical protein